MWTQPVGSSSVLYTKHQQATIQSKMIQDGEHMLAARVWRETYLCESSAPLHVANKFVNGARDSEIERERELWRYVVTLDIQHVYIYMYMTIRVHVYIRINICIYIIYCCNSTSCHVSSHLYNQGVQLRNQLCGIPGILILSTRRNTCQHIWLGSRACPNDLVQRQPSERSITLKSQKGHSRWHVPSDLQSEGGTRVFVGAERSLKTFCFSFLDRVIICTKRPCPTSLEIHSCASQQWPTLTQNTSLSLHTSMLSRSALSADMDGAPCVGEWDCRA